MICPKCKTTIPDGRTKCPKCGTDPKKKDDDWFSLLCLVAIGKKMRQL